MTADLPQVRRLGHRDAQGAETARGRWRAAAVVALAAVLPLILAEAAEAHIFGPPREPGTLAWNWDPVLLPSLILAGWLYVRGLRKIWRKGGRGRGAAVWQAAAFAGGMLALVVALVSPLEALAEQLASVHMVQHMILMMVAAPLLVLAAPVPVMLVALPRAWRKPVGRAWHRVEAWPGGRHLLWNPLFTWLLYAAVNWIWHFPDFYNATLRSNFVHVMQHLTFFVAGLLFWRVAIDPLSSRRMDYGLGVVYLFTTTVHTGVLGIWMTFSPEPWYAEYLGRTEVWGFTPLEDQQMAGLVMWMPGGKMYAMVAAVIFWRWLQQLETGTDRVQGTPPAEQQPAPVTR